MVTQQSIESTPWQMLLSSQESSSIQIENDTIKFFRTKKLLQINIDNKLKFGGSACQKAYRKLNSVARINYIELSKRQIFINEFFKAKFNYYPTIWMFHSHSMNDKISRLYERL